MVRGDILGRPDGDLAGVGSVQVRGKLWCSGGWESWLPVNLRTPSFLHVEG